jgi:hypothetical protein
LTNRRTALFAFWWHERTFTALYIDVTLMVDVVRFAAPLRPLGILVEGVVLSYMAWLLEQRNRWLKAALEDLAKE